MSITIKFNQVLSEKLKASLIKLASMYYPTGVINVSDIIVDTTRLCDYFPDNPEYGSLAIRIIGDEINAIGNQYSKDTNPRVIAFIDAFNKAKNRVADKQTAPVQAPIQQQRLVKSTLQLDVKLFNGLDLPKSATSRTLGKAQRTVKGKPIQMTVKYAITPETQTHYLLIESAMLTTNGRARHRLQGKSGEELLNKLSSFICSSTPLPANKYASRQGHNILINAQGLAELLVTAI